MKYYKLFLVLAIIGIVLAYAYPRVAAHASSNKVTNTVTVSQGTWIVTKPIALPAILRSIASCESPHGQFYKGQVVTHVNNDGSYDIGEFQINSTHLAEAKALGFDLETRAGNEAFALRLYQQEGVSPWSSSEYCWG